MRRWVRDGALALCLVILALGALELLARAIEPDDRRSRILRFDPPPPRSEDTFRVFTFGASSVFGNPVPRLGFVEQLRFWLERGVPGGRVEVFNYAKPGSPSWAIRDAVLETLKWGPDLIVVHTGFGEFLLEDPPTPSDDLLRWAMRSSAFVRRARLLAGRLVTNLAPTTEVEAIDVRPFHRDSDEFRERVARYPRNLERIVEAARQSGVPLLLATASSNLADWPPTNRSFARELYPDGFARKLDLIDQLIRAEGVVEARELAEKHLRDRPDDAMLHFLLARALVGEGEYDLARTHFRRARDLDPLPWRALSEINDLIRSKADGEHVILVDVERAFEEHSPNGLTGFEMVADNSHPSPRGAAVVADAILRAMARNGLAIPPDAEYFSIEDPHAIFMDHIRQTARIDLESRVLAKSALYCMGFPYQHYGAARTYLRKLLLRNPREWGAWANLASISFLEGNVERGTAELRRAVQVKGSSQGLMNRNVAPHLKRAMNRAGVDLQSALIQGRVR